jgi:YfiH family protein
MAADCMPVLLTDQDGTAVAAAHAGWRGLCAGVIEAALDAMQRPPESVLAWLGPAIGPRAYEVGAEVREAFLSRDAAAAAAFAPTRPDHWLLDLYMIARQRLERRGVSRIYGGGFCTYSDAERFYSFRRERTAERMAALIWLT